MTSFSQAMYEELLNEVKQLKIIAKGQEKRIMLLESKLASSNGSPVSKRKTNNNNTTMCSGSSSSIELTDPIQVWIKVSQNASQVLLRLIDLLSKIVVAACCL